MNPERSREALRLFEALSALPEAEREAFLLRECADDELRAEVQKLLALRVDQTFLEPPPLDEPRSGRDLGDFTLLEEIGRGGMGVVYRALQRPLSRVVALKVLPPSFALTPRQVDRFQREARSAARLSHPNLVAVLTVGEERGVHFFAMEFVDGKNLAEELVRLRADLGAEHDDHAHLPSSHATDYFRSVAECVRQAADGLAFAHASGVVHRDVKPSNLLLDPSGRVKLVDFGLARDEEQGSLSTSGDMIGTAHYMSPEQARAKRDAVDHRTDIYSLGVVLYELLTLKRPFEGQTSQEVISNLLHAEAPRIRKVNPRVPRDLETICTKAMAREPRDRYIDAGALCDDLRRFLSHEAILARPPGALRIAHRFVLRRRVPLAAAGVTLFAAAFGWNLRAVFAAERALVSIEAPGHDGALVWDTLLVPLTTEVRQRRKLGVAPIHAQEVDLGLHCFTVEEPGVGFAELTRVLQRRDGDYRLSAAIRPTADVTASAAEPLLTQIVEIPAGEFVFGVERHGDVGWPPYYERCRVFLPTFWIDRYEVSNGEYERFVRQTGHAWPKLWPAEGSPEWRALPERWPRLPVAGVSYNDALAYAEWAGKRLPTEWEWEKAARGPDGWELPWQLDSALGHDPSGRARAVVDRPYREAVDERLANYLAAVAPVDSFPEGRSPYGLHHTLGNAAEWTESLWFHLDGDGVLPSWNTHVLRGGGYDRQPGGWSLCGSDYGVSDHIEGVATYGFRCAKSSGPERGGSVSHNHNERQE